MTYPLNPFDDFPMPKYLPMAILYAFSEMRGELWRFKGLDFHVRDGLRLIDNPQEA